jgi:hypothetical protein
MRYEAAGYTSRKLRQVASVLDNKRFTVWLIKAVPIRGGHRLLWWVRVWCLSNQRIGKTLTLAHMLKRLLSFKWLILLRIPPMLLCGDLLRDWDFRARDNACFKTYLSRIAAVALRTGPLGQM